MNTVGLESSMASEVCAFLFSCVNAHTCHLDKSFFILYKFFFFLTVNLTCIICGIFVTGWFPAKFVEILDERSKEVLKQLIISLISVSMLTFHQFFSLVFFPVS